MVSSASAVHPGHVVGLAEPGAALPAAEPRAPGQGTRVRTGVVVCGGLSRRMGTDKAGLEVGGTTLLERAIEALRPVVDEVLLATGSEPRYAERGLRIVLDRETGLGPLSGLEAALRGAAGDRVVCLAVDMPRVDATLVARLLERAERDDCDALLLAGESGVEPLCAVYHVRVLAAVQAALDAGNRRMTDLFTHELADGRVARLDRFDAREHGFALATTNVNSSDELERARASSGAEIRS